MGLRNKRRIALILLIALALGLGGCAREAKGPESVRLSIVASVFPAYDFARALTKGVDVSLTLLLKPGVESHTFDPAPADIAQVEKADLFLYIGGENEMWAERVVGAVDPRKVKPLKLLERVETLDEEIVPGMEAEPEEEPAPDEHIWTSPKNAKLMVEAILSAMCQADPAHANAYRANARAYQAQLDGLDSAFRAVVSGGVRKEILFGDRFPFRYLTEELGLTYYAAFPGCSHEAEPSAATVAFLIDRAREDHIPVIYHIEQGNLKTASVIAAEAGAKPLLMHSCHNLSKAEWDAGETYMSLMKANVEALREGLS